MLSPEGLLNYQDLCINTAAHEVRIKQESLSLSPIEYQLLLLFIKNPNQTFSRHQLLDRLSDNNHDNSDRSIDAHIRRLRARLKPFSYDHYIQTIRGAGYQWGIKK